MIHSINKSWVLWMHTHIFGFWRYRPPGSRTTGLRMTILAYFDQNSVRFFDFFLQEISLLRTLVIKMLSTCLIIINDLDKSYFAPLPCFNLNKTGWINWKSHNYRTSFKQNILILFPFVMKGGSNYHSPSGGGVGYCPYSPHDNSTAVLVGDR